MTEYDNYLARREVMRSIAEQLRHHQAKLAEIESPEHTLLSANAAQLLRWHIETLQQRLLTLAQANDEDTKRN